ncbi:ATP-binding cassette domain-containing protein [Billgrantia azerbaijanica]|nr:ATP-binding cassette domain-containing protein [Halomonas azerbaijanica]
MASEKTQASQGALATAEVALEVRHLGFRFAGPAVLDDLSFTLRAGEFAVLLGPNGAGKTTLFSLVTNLYAHRQGTIRIGGFDVRRQSVQAHARIGVVFQQPTLDMGLSVGQNLLYHGALHGLGPRRTRELAERQLARLGMQGEWRTRVRQLSGGQRRRVEIARGLLHDPRLLLLDEPTTGLDIAARRELVEHVHALCREQGVAVLWATHLIDEAKPQDRVLVLHRGRLRADGGVAEVIARTGSASLGEAFERLTEGEAQ